VGYQPLQRFAAVLFLTFLLGASLWAQGPGTPVAAQATASSNTPWWDLGGRFSDRLAAETGGKLRLTLEFRGRYESRAGVAFGNEHDRSAALFRTRLGLSWQPVSWLKASAMMQDSRAPLYGENAPSNVRDQADLHEAHFELAPNPARGSGLAAGRAMLTYGEGRLIGTPQWGNLARTYDHARLFYRLPRARLELLFVSPVKIRPQEFNRPALGDHVWGTYMSFPNLFSKSLVDVYVLRHSQNRPGGFAGGSKAAGTDRLGIGTFGFRAAGPLAHAMKYSMEGAVQGGKVGAATHRGGAWYSAVSRRFAVARKTVDLSADYKFASGTRDPSDARRVGTFDHLYGAFHDVFGHQDLFGWRNIHNVRGLGTAGLRKNLALNLMYNTYWLASVRDALYNTAGRPIASSRAGAAGRHVGQEADLFATCRFGHLQVGAGYGRFFQGSFIRHTTPGISPAYVYLFHTYSF
jgi:hypothetical protein